MVQRVSVSGNGSGNTGRVAAGDRFGMNARKEGVNYQDFCPLITERPPEAVLVVGETQYLLNRFERCSPTEQSVRVEKLKRLFLGLSLRRGGSSFCRRIASEEAASALDEPALAKAGRVRDRHRQAMTLCGMGRLRLEPGLSLAREWQERPDTDTVSHESVGDLGL